MCGIFGVAGDVTGGGIGGTAGIDEAQVSAALRLLSHRGPDAQGVARKEAALFGHTRLRILDLTEAGAQPMQSVDGAVTVTFNGEIYNHRALREELTGRGHAFRSRSDTEVLVHGYREWGDGLPERLDGMFAFAIWDERRRRLLMARDRAGEKPLFYHHDPARGLLRFASEVKALAPLGALLQLSEAGLMMLLSFGFVPAPGSLYTGVAELPPATLLTLEAGGAPRTRSYWRAPFLDAPRATLKAEALRMVRHLTIEAVRTRLDADVPLGAFLSGGIDSSIVVGVLSRVLQRRVKTFSIGFADDPRYDETRYAREAAACFETEHTEFIVSQRELDLVALIEKLVFFHDGPFADSSAIPTYLVAQLTREHVTVALTGDGGDELFCGYPRLIAAEAAEYLPGGLLGGMLALSGRLPGSDSERSLLSRARRFLSAAALPLAERMARWSSLFCGDLPRLLRPDLRAGLDLLSPMRWHSGFFDSDRSPLGRILWHNFATYLPCDLLVKVDRTTMAHALEARAPFLSPALIEYAATLPDSYRRRGLLMKRVLREAFADLLPPSIQRRGKMGFGVPLGGWLRGALREHLLDHLGAGARLYQYLDQKVVGEYLTQHLSGQADHGHRLWTLLTLEIWLRTQPAWTARTDTRPRA